MDLERSGATFRLPEPLTPQMREAFEEVRNIMQSRRWLFAVRSWQTPAFLSLIALVFLGIAVFEGHTWWRVFLATAASVVATSVSYLLTGFRGRIRIVARNAPTWRVRSHGRRGTVTERRANFQGAIAVATLIATAFGAVFAALQYLIPPPPPP